MPLPKPGDVVTTPEKRRAYVLSYAISEGCALTAHTPELAPIAGMHVQYLDDGTLETLDRGWRRRCVVIDGDGTALATC